MQILEVFNNYSFFGITLSQMISFIGIIFLILFIDKFLSLVIFKFLRKKAKKTGTSVDDEIIEAVEKPIIWLFYVVSIYFALLLLGVKDTDIPLQSLARGAAETLSAMCITILSFRVVDVFDLFLASHLDKEKEKKRKDLLIFYFFPLLKRSLKVAITFIAVILVVQNWGYSVTSLVAGFGITGLAVGFAAKESIANVFGRYLL